MATDEHGLTRITSKKERAIAYPCSSVAESFFLLSRGEGIYQVEVVLLVDFPGIARHIVFGVGGEGIAEVFAADEFQHVVRQSLDVSRGEEAEVGVVEIVG